MNFLEAIGEALAFSSRMIQTSDGSWIAVQTDKASYCAGEIITGKVIAHITTPKVVDKVVLKVMCKEKVEWEEERSHTEYEGEGENRRAITRYSRHDHKFKSKIFKDVIVVSTLAHMLPPGTYQYPFSYQLRPDLPGCFKHKRSQRSMDPHHHHPLQTEASVCYTLKAQFETAGTFARDIKCREEIIINSFFDWNKMQPARAHKEGDVIVCCCFNKGKAALTCDFDKAAYAAGEVAQVKAYIKNESTKEIAHMRVQLMRNISIRDGSGHSRSFSDRIAVAEYSGVGPQRAETRDLPLPLQGKNGSKEFLPSTNAPHVSCNYVFEVVCDIKMAFDIEAKLPMVVYTPAPLVWGLAAQFNGQVPSYAASFVTTTTSTVASPMGAVSAVGGAGAFPMGYQSAAGAV